MDGPPLTVAVSNINVSGVTGAVQNISVNLNIAHTYDGDVTINLKAPNGNIFNLHGRMVEHGDNFTNTTLSSTCDKFHCWRHRTIYGTYAAEGASAVGIAPNVSNVTSWCKLILYSKWYMESYLF